MIFFTLVLNWVCFLEEVTSSRRSVSRRAAQKTAHEKIKTRVARTQEIKTYFVFSHRACFFCFFLAQCFRASPQLTEHLEEAIKKATFYHYQQDHHLIPYINYV